ncbi:MULTISPECIES: ABC transporter ATP-binding protein [unclassified Bradyrhizobium]|uniref:ABC transporter ATP-binding protein n=1 Tax=unclassified Bradyrhizobium TaxID=2631580 RepID=UPI001FFBD66C|nr:MULTISPECIES: ABC transporter ATP-binding protein [unclassified Bradyrhizobium]MCK1592563.1 ABC transporter ATP-binding protein [Bradyrhizobium sp. 169]UPJ31616.1 ABC transporter ATP-binding protein [Bradyrhizobium sp. CW1]UPK23304.1 ABC transporter ATP-binding protein [Bradyrhizobium sp. 131]
MADLEINDVSMSFVDRSGKGLLALDRISLAIEDSEFVCLIGHSGCGKSTLLNIVAGLLAPTKGAIRCAGTTISGPRPERAMVFQSHALLPWMTCYENVRLAVKQAFKGAAASELKDRSEQALKLVHLEHAINKYPFEVSGGMKQRVGIARAFAVEPKVLLLDEPFGALDALTKSSLQDELVRIVEKTPTTVVMVTHDIDEAIFLSDRIVALSNGPAARIGRIWEIDTLRPRDRLKLATHAGSLQYRKEILEYLYQRECVPQGMVEL